MDTEQIGTIELLQARVYPLDPAAKSHPLSTGVIVPPGVYPVYRVADAYYWIMTGQINARGVQKIGDGTFAIIPGDEPIGPEVTFPSDTFGPKQFTALLADPTCTEGHPGQRLRFTLIVSTDT